MQQGLTIKQFFTKAVCSSSSWGALVTNIYYNINMRESYCNISQSSITALAS